MRLVATPLGEAGYPIRSDPGSLARDPRSVSLEQGLVVIDHDTGVAIREVALCLRGQGPRRRVGRVPSAGAARGPWCRSPPLGLQVSHGARCRFWKSGMLFAVRTGNATSSRIRWAVLREDGRPIAERKNFNIISIIARVGWEAPGLLLVDAGDRPEGELIHWTREEGERLVSGQPVLESRRQEESLFGS